MSSFMYQKMNRVWATRFLVAVLAVQVYGEAEVVSEIDWPAFIGAQDPHWDRLPQTWRESPFVGNGLMGSMIFQTSPTQLVIQVGRSDVNDHRLASGKQAMNNVLPDSSRLPIGYFTLDTESPVTGCDLRVDVYNAEIAGTLETEAGEIAIRSFVHSEVMLLVVEADGGEADVPFSFTWHPEEAFCPRTKGKRERDPEYRSGYVPNPAPVVDLSGDIKTCRQDLITDGQTGTAWIVNQDGSKQTLMASVGHSFPESDALDTAIGVVDNYRSQSYEDLAATHRSWWHDFYERSFISIPDQRLNSFYWLQNYKMAAATKGGYAIADNQGPWLQPTGWPGTWWNLNVQLAYSHLPTANYPDLARGLVDHLHKHRDNLRKNAPDWMEDAMAINTVSGWDLLSPMKDPTKDKNVATGNLMWAIHNVYMGYRHTMDDELLEEKILPLLRPTLNYYFQIMIEGEDGKIHLPNTNSPEYDGKGTRNCNYDLALLRWGCQTLIGSAERLGLEDPMVAQCQDVLARLVDYPVDETGYRIGQDTQYERSHRHYSHLLMIYPLYLVTADQPENRRLIKKSIDHWQSLPERLQGYSYTGSSSMYSSLGLGNIAERRMQNFLNDKVLSNTFYAEGSPVIETPPAGARSIQDMLIQSWGDTIRVFPAVPTKWTDASFANLSAEGGFLVSASRSEGKTRFIQVHSRAGEPCKLATGIEGDCRVIGISSDRVTALGAGVLELVLDKGQTALVVSNDYEGDLKIAPVHHAYFSDWSWGLNSTP